MQFVRKSALGLVVSLLIATLITFGITFGLLKVFGTSGPIKNAFKESGFYQTIVGNALDLAQKSEKSESPDQIPINRPEVQDIIRSAASPAYLQTQTEQTLDSIYAWLQGKKPKLDFAIDLADVKVRLADGLEQYAIQHLATLPTCKAGSVPRGNLDPFQASCLPRGTNIKSVAAQAKNEILNGEFLKDSQITAESIKTQDGQQTLAQQVEKAPGIYQNVVRGIYGLGLLALLLSAALVSLSSSRRSGLKKLAIIIIVIGASSILIGIAAGFGINRAADVLVRNDPMQESAMRVAEILVSDLRGWWVGYGAALILVGVGTLVALHLLKKRSGDAGEKPADPGVTAPDKPADKTDQLTETKTKPKNDKRPTQL